MISISRDELLELSKGTLVGGNVLALVNGENQILARATEDGFQLTEDGKSFVENASKPAPKKARATKAAKSVEEEDNGDILGDLE